MEDLEKLINEGNEDQVVEALREENGEGAEYARLLFQKGLKHLVYPIFCDASPDTFGELISTKDNDVIGGLFSNFGYDNDILRENFWNYARDIQKTGDLLLFKYFVSSVRFNELSVDGSFSFYFNEFAENPEITNDECSLEFEEAEKLLLLAKDCIEDGHQENLKFLEEIYFILRHENPEGLIDEASFRLNNTDALSMDGGHGY